MLCMRGLRRTGWRFRASSRIAAGPRPGRARSGDSRSGSNATSREAYPTRSGCHWGAAGARACPVLIRMRSVGQGQRSSSSRGGGKTGGSTPAYLSQLSHTLSGRRRTEEDSLDIRRILTCGYGFWRTGWTDGIDLRIKRPTALGMALQRP